MCAIPRMLSRILVEYKKIKNFLFLVYQDVSGIRMALQKQKTVIFPLETKKTCYSKDDGAPGRCFRGTLNKAGKAAER